MSTVANLTQIEKIALQKRIIDNKVFSDQFAKLYYYYRRSITNETILDDVIFGARAKVIEAIIDGSYDMEQTALKTFINRTVKNRFIDKVTNKNKKHKHLTRKTTSINYTDSEENEVLQVADKSANTFADFVRKEQLLALDKAIKGLKSEQEQQILTLVCEGFTNKEIALKVGLISLNSSQPEINKANNFIARKKELALDKIRKQWGV